MFPRNGDFALVVESCVLSKDPLSFPKIVPMKAEDYLLLKETLDDVSVGSASEIFSRTATGV